MIDPKAIISYAQYNEDIILSALLHDVNKGFYVDVGANSPTLDSVTKHFYDRGWRGINIEPIKKYFDQLEKDRPNDINLQVGVGDKEGAATLREYPKNLGYSTFTDSQKNQHGNKYPYIDYEVKTVLLRNILVEYKVNRIHFLKIDAEGFEYEVIAGSDWRKYRPEVICIESSHMVKDWRPMLTQNDYRLFITDGLNDYYVAKEAWDRTKDFDERVTRRHAHTLKLGHFRSWKKDSEKLDKLSNMVKHQENVIKKLEKDIQHLQELAELSLKNQPMRERLKRSVRGLTTDWREFKKKQHQ